MNADYWGGNGPADFPPDTRQAASGAIRCARGSGSARDGGLPNSSYWWRHVAKLPFRLTAQGRCKRITQ